MFVVLLSTSRKMSHLNEGGVECLSCGFYFPILLLMPSILLIRMLAGKVVENHFCNFSIIIILLLLLLLIAIILLLLHLLILLLLPLLLRMLVGRAAS